MHSARNLLRAENKDAAGSQALGRRSDNKLAE